MTFEDKFLIADVKMAADFPTERRFWFDPQFHSGQSALMHRQPDNVWRIDLQLGPDADVEAEQKPERVLPRLKKMLGERDFELEWVSIYRFNCRRLAAFRAWPGDFRGRQRASGLAVRRARRQFRRAGRREHCLEARRHACAARPGRACSHPTSMSACRRRTRISATPPARPISSRRIRMRNGICAMPCSISRRAASSRGAW